MENRGAINTENSAAMSSPDVPPAPDYAAANREAISTDVSTLPTRRLIEQAASLGQLVNYTDPATGRQMTADFRGLGEAATYKQLADLANQFNADTQRQQLALRQELGTANAEQTAKELQAADPTAYATRQNLTEKILGNLQNGPEQISANQSIYDAATRLGAIDPSTSALNEGLQQALADYNTAGFSAPVQRELTNQIRAGQTARGNFLGDAAAVSEASQQGQAMEALRSQRLGQLLSVQQQAFGQNQQQNQAALQGAQAAAGEQRTVENTNFGREQQNLANASAMVLGQPITNQFGALQAAQNGAVGYQQAPQPGQQQLNPNSAAQVYQGQLNAWQSQAAAAQQGNPWMTVGGQAAGAAAAAAAAYFI
jgi:hypothetical protein